MNREPTGRKLEEKNMWDEGRNKHSKTKTDTRTQNIYQSIDFICSTGLRKFIKQS